MEASRRDFLKISSLGVGVSLVQPFKLFESFIKPDIPTQHSKFDASNEYGNYIPLYGFENIKPDNFGKLLDTLFKDMRKIIPPKYRKRVQIRKQIPTDYGRFTLIAWHYSPFNKIIAKPYKNRFILNRKGGYLLLV